MNLAIVGSRTFNTYKHYTLLSNTVYDLFYLYLPSLVIISGGAMGADSYAKKYANEHDLDYIEFPAKWDKYGRKAGYVRNSQIVNACDVVLAFWNGESKGTKHTIDLAKEAKKPTFIVYF